MKLRRWAKIGLISALLVWGGGLCAGSRRETAAVVLDSEEQEEPNRKAEPRNDPIPENFSEEIAQQVIGRVAEGFEQHNARRLLSAFDHDRMAGYVNFRDQIEAMFAGYDSFRIHFVVRQFTSQGDTGIAVADFQLEEIPRSEDAQPVRKNEQVRFEVARGKSGWKIIDVKPRSFFS